MFGLAVVGCGKLEQPRAPKDRRMAPLYKTVCGPPESPSRQASTSNLNPSITWAIELQLMSIAAGIAPEFSATEPNKADNSPLAASLVRTHMPITAGPGQRLSYNSTTNDKY